WFTGLEFHAQRLSPAWFIHLQTPAEYREAVAENGPVRAVFRPLRRAGRAQGAVSLDQLIAAEVPLTGLLAGMEMSRATVMC
ncbi:MAG: hypothetical protein N2689_02510, partial [Verrucomicrobiae bacterium]|nr:hypothetical protein [Verrucomicrobiae bacterium]